MTENLAKELREHYHVKLGEGLVVVNWGKYDGRPAIFFERANNGGPVGAKVSAEDILPKNSLKAGAVVVSFSNGAEEVLQDALNHAVDRNIPDDLLLAADAYAQEQLKTGATHTKRYVKAFLAGAAWNRRPALDRTTDAEREEDHHCVWRLRYAGLKAHWDALGEELTEYGVPADWPEYQELRKALLEKGIAAFDEKPTPQQRINHYFKVLPQPAPVQVSEAMVTERMAQLAFYELAKHVPFPGPYDYDRDIGGMMQALKIALAAVGMQGKEKE